MVGNFLLYYDILMKVVSIAADGKLHKELAPIQLNSRVLELCYFEYETEKEWLRLRSGKMVFQTDDSVNFEIVQISADERGQVTLASIRHLHELQNWHYWSMNRRPLKIDENGLKQYIHEINTAKK